MAGAAGVAALGTATPFFADRPPARAAVTRSSAGALVAPLFDARRLAAQTAEVVQLGAPHLAPPHDLDPVDVRRMQREHALDADAAGHLAHGEHLARAAAP